MSSRVGSTVSGSCIHSVSVVPISQYVGDGMTKSTLLPVGMISAVSPVIADRGKRRCTPFDRITPTASADPVNSADTSGAQTPTHRATLRVVTVN